MIRIFVHTPFQVICAAEFIAAKARLFPGRDDDCELVVFPTGGPSNWLQARQAADRLGLEYRALGGDKPDTLRGKISKLREFRREIDTLSANDVLVAGNPGLDIFVTALGKLDCEKWALDDGLMTARFLHAIRDGRGAGWATWEPAGSRIASRLLVGKKREPDWDTVNWFTLFARYYDGMARVHRNDFASLRDRSRVSGQANTVLFLGSPLVKSKVFSEATYRAFCRHAAGFLRTQYPGCRLVYRCHRSEGEEERHAHGFFDAVEVSSGPVELSWLGEGESVPAAVAGIMSTALISLAELLPETAGVHVFWPDASVRIIEPRFDPAELLPLFRKAEEEGMVGVRVVSDDEVANGERKVKSEK